LTREQRTIDINADLGEGFPNDHRLLELVTSASISCGAHAGDAATIFDTISMAKELNVAVGAHPGFADREGFGRREQTVSADDVALLVLSQVDVLRKVVAAPPHNVPLLFVKPHGALYNQAQRQSEVALGIIMAMEQLCLPVLGQPRSVLERLAAEAGVRFVAEGFPDRRYEPDGRLVPRTRPDAILHDPAEIEAQVARFVGEGIETVCIHGDDPRAVANAEQVLGALERRGVVPRFWGLG
jgi:UPF0271 protein